MKVKKILICTTSAILIFAMGMVCQSLISSKCEDDKAIDSTKVSSPTNGEDSVDIYSADYQINERRMAREETEAMEIEYEENHENVYDNLILGMWKRSNSQDSRFEFQKDGKCQLWGHDIIKPDVWFVVGKGQYTINGNILHFKIKIDNGRVIEKEWEIQSIENGKMPVRYQDYDDYSKTHKTCEIILKQIR